MERRRGWTFLSNHSHVLVTLAKDPTLTVREIADRIGITERAVAQILADLEEAQVLLRWREGRRNVYQINADAPLRHDVESHRTVRDLLRLAEPAAVPNPKAAEIKKPRSGAK